MPLTEEQVFARTNEGIQAEREAAKARILARRAA